MEKNDIKPNMKFGAVRTIRPVVMDEGGERTFAWLCRCQCGEKFAVTPNALAKGIVQCCQRCKERDEMTKEELAMHGLRPAGKRKDTGWDGRVTIVKTSYRCCHEAPRGSGRNKWRIF